MNIFAYSIGAFLAQIIMMGNPGSLFTESKLFLFCGGSVFSNMHGTSKFIMDSLAYRKVYSYYLDEFENRIKGKSQLTDFLQTDTTGMAFRSMIDLGRHRNFREKAIKRIYDQTRSVALAGDLSFLPQELLTPSISVAEILTIR